MVGAGRGELSIRAPIVLRDSKPGDSIAVNGVDLTVAEIRGDTFLAQVMPETYRRSNLGRLVPGDRVNLERSVRPLDRLSGHLVRGVVEGTAALESFSPEGEAILACYATSPELLRFMVVKGPVAVDGVSLTVVAKTDRSFTVSLVQFTQKHTNLLDRKPGDPVNIETDIIARYVHAAVEAHLAGIRPS
ncbi:MAG: riboflavin synthase subunit alpha [Candidatus Binatia bacterium]|nr:MAG: riboflavin synthase subunit alpha [Candidatus Binatia bacterium]